MRFSAFILALSFLVSIAPAKAQMPFTHQLFRVDRCDAQANVSVIPRGFRPGFYPRRGPWFWTDPYGFRFYQPPFVTTNPSMYVDFTNITNHVMTTVVWGLVANGRLVAEVRDVGTFSPGARIQRAYGISINAFPLQTALPQCVALDVIFQNGTRHRNPNLPPMHRSMYVSPPPSR
jgi:hypothetical protein